VKKPSSPWLRPLRATHVAQLVIKWSQPRPTGSLHGAVTSDANGQVRWHDMSNVNSAELCAAYGWNSTGPVSSEHNTREDPREDVGRVGEDVTRMLRGNCCRGIWAYTRGSLSVENVYVHQVLVSRVHDLSPRTIEFIRRLYVVGHPVGPVYEVTVHGDAERVRNAFRQQDLSKYHGNSHRLSDGHNP